jgi:AcrR family transcriptional regulator
MSPEPVSRRDRPAKMPLSRGAIVATALNLLRSDGLDRLTMRRLAAALNTGAASLYVYFRNAEQLHGALLDELLGDVDLAAMDPAARWQDRLAAVLASYAGVLFAYPSVARLSVFTRPSGPNGLRLLEALLGLLREGGVAPGAAAWGSDQLLQYATVTAAEHGVRDEMAATGDDTSDMWQALASVKADELPHVYALRDTLMAGEEGERFRWGVDVLLAGLLDARSGVVPSAHVMVSG